MQCDPHVASIYEADFRDTEIREFDYFIQPANLKVLQEALEFKPTHVICLGACGSPYDIQKETFKQLRKTAKTILLCPEASHPEWHKLIQSYYDYDCLDLIVNLDGAYWEQQDKGHTTLAIYGVEPYRKYPYRIWQKRPINVGFCGGVGGPGTMRLKLLDYLKEQKLVTIFNFIETRGTYQQYADFMMSCKIVVNCAGSSGDRSKHVKGRVVEAGLAGACLLEEVGSPIAKWIREGSYFTFHGLEDCKNQIEFLLSHPEQARISASYLHDDVIMDFHPKRQWQKIFSLLNRSSS